ncbi:MAG: hypothetical protein KGI06_03160 [Candidatus Micrarchaeota archaeon]|nr:hypothetical protein [Candidatus Micrarchaeota archaeon]
MPMKKSTTIARERTTEDDLIVSIIPAHQKGHSYKLYLGAEASRWGLENNIRRFKLIANRNGGSMLIVPLRDPKIRKELESAKNLMSNQM